MKTEQEIKAMIKELDDANENFELDETGEAILTALLWAQGDHDDSTITAYFKE